MNLYELYVHTKINSYQNVFFSVAFQKISTLSFYPFLFGFMYEVMVLINFDQIVFLLGFMTVAAIFQKAVIHPF